MLRKSAMYNLKVSTALANGGGAPGAGVGLLAADPQGVTPRTPEILNSLMAMTHPLDPAASSAAPNPSTSAAVPDLCSPSAGSSSSSGLMCGSPTRSPPSLQHTRSQLIKEGLKLTLQTKRRHTSATSATSASGASVSGGSGDEDEDLSGGGKRRKRDQLTPEDEERRRRRRERNKVAATKCRIKKRERTVNLVQESEILESQNYELKTQIQELETQRRRLVDMLSSHSPNCTRPGHVHQPAHQPAHQPPPYDLYSPSATYCPSPSAGPSLPAPDLGHHHHHHHQQDHQSQVQDHGAYGDVLMGQYMPQPEDDHLPPYFAVTKHEVVDDPLLAALEDPLDMYGYSQPLAHYDRPGSLALDTPVSTPGSTAGSLDSPHHASLHQAVPLPGPSHHYPHMSSTPLTPLPLGPDGVSVFGMDSGCMA
ncbi:transcription factor kayak [Thrips palmi]|uniref:Transcription factor kayak n=1 Tax=Thrips palmi TaxID=161013 RepID=A0A6P8ZTZ6_THRPL|nr:transcription factor kayak [Thrips palmi]